MAVRQRGASIPVSRIVEMLENPGKPFDFKGTRVNYPDVKLAYWVGGNPFATTRTATSAIWRHLSFMIFN